MSKELPFFKFYPSEWIMGRINYESPQDQCAFLRVCCHYWHKNCNITVKELINVVTIEKLRSLHRKGYIEIPNWVGLQGYDKVDEHAEVYIKFLDEQQSELGNARQKRVDAGRLGGLKTQSMIKQSLSNDKAVLKDLDKEKDKEEIKIEKKSKKQYINDAMNHPDPRQRLTKDIATKLVNAKIKKGEIQI